MRATEDGLRFAPFCPAPWTRFRFSIRYRGRLLRVTVGTDATEYLVVTGHDLEVMVNGDRVMLKSGEARVVPNVA